MADFAKNCGEISTLGILDLRMEDFECSKLIGLKSFNNLMKKLRSKLIVRDLMIIRLEL